MRKHTQKNTVVSLDISSNDLKLYFDYLRDVLYYPKRAAINNDELSDKEHRDFAEALIAFGSMVMEARDFAMSLARGELECKLPSVGNELAAPLKSLHATLKHITWQTKQISCGDYDQHVEFMGEFSEAFNDMVLQLAERSRQMEAEAKRNQERMEELAKANSIFEAITSRMEEWIAMVDRTTGEHLFANHAAENLFIDGIIESQVYDLLLEHVANLGSDDTPRKESFSLISDNLQQSFEIMLYPLRWFEHDAVACVLADITAHTQEYNRLEDAAYKDEMTGIYNRLFGMKLLDRYTREHVPYRLIFVDMDMLKYVNDVFGHAEGDVYIRNVAEILQEISDEATICRIGGDEFMIILHERDVCGRDMFEVLENLRNKLINSPVTGKDGKTLYHRSISYGIKTVGEDNTLTISDILAAADDLMYEYKKAHKQERRV